MCAEPCCKLPCGLTINPWGINMFGLFKSYDAEYFELFEYLTRQWKMKPEYAEQFLKAYKKSIGKIYSRGKKRMQMLANSSNPQERMARYLSLGEEHDYALVGQAYKSYMSDLKRGRHIGSPIEKVIWAILVNRSDLVKSLDGGFSDWIERKHEEKFPDLFDDVFPDEAE